MTEPTTDDPYGSQRMQRMLTETYRERAQLVALLAAIYPSTWGIDFEWPDWHVVYVQLPTGQASWHISPNDFELFTHVYGPTGAWDGHTTEEKYQRIRELVTQLAIAGGVNDEHGATVPADAEES